MNNFKSMNTRLELKNQYDNDKSIVNNRNNENIKMFKPINKNSFINFENDIDKKNLTTINENFKKNYTESGIINSPSLYQDRNITSTRMMDTFEIDNLSPLKQIDDNITNTPIHTSTNTPIRASTNTPIRASTNTPIRASTNTPIHTSTKIHDKSGQNIQNNSIINTIKLKHEQLQIYENKINIIKEQLSTEKVDFINDKKKILNEINKQKQSNRDILNDISLKQTEYLRLKYTINENSSKNQLVQVQLSNEKSQLSVLNDELLAERNKLDIYKNNLISERNELDKYKNKLLIEENEIKIKRKELISLYNQNIELQVHNKNIQNIEVDKLSQEIPENKLDRVKLKNILKKKFNTINIDLLDLYLDKNNIVYEKDLGKITTVISDIKHLALISTPDISTDTTIIEDNNVLSKQIQLDTGLSETVQLDTGLSETVQLDTELSEETVQLTEYELKVPTDTTEVNESKTYASIEKKKLEKTILDKDNSDIANLKDSDLLYNPDII